MKAFSDANMIVKLALTNLGNKKSKEKKTGSLNMFLTL